MFKEKAMVTPPKKKDITINMVLAITTNNQTQKCAIQGEKTSSQEQEFGRLARRGKASTFV
jgi:hypothetical protein